MIRNAKRRCWRPKQLRTSLSRSDDVQFEPSPSGNCLSEFPIVQTHELLRRLVGLDGARLDPSGERTLQRLRNIKLSVEAEAAFHRFD
jgi:hypothetical protein